MDLGLKGKKAIVTGGTRGIGRAIAETLAAEGCDVAICARNADQVNEAVAALSKKGVKALGGTADIADGEALKKWIADTAKAMGGLDILVANASALQNGNDEKSWRARFEIDVLGAVNASRRRCRSSPKRPRSPAMPRRLSFHRSRLPKAMAPTLTVR